MKKINIYLLGGQNGFRSGSKKHLLLQNTEKDGDTGSSEVQIALLSEQIKILTDHLKVFKKITLQD